MKRKLVIAICALLALAAMTALVIYVQKAYERAQPVPIVGNTEHVVGIKIRYRNPETDYLEEVTDFDRQEILEYLASCDKVWLRRNIMSMGKSVIEIWFVESDPNAPENYRLSDIVLGRSYLILTFAALDDFYSGYYEIANGEEVLDGIIRILGL